MLCDYSERTPVTTKPRQQTPRFLRELGTSQDKATQVFCDLLRVNIGEISKGIIGGGSRRLVKTIDPFLRGW